MALGGEDKFNWKVKRRKTLTRVTAMIIIIFGLIFQPIATAWDPGVIPLDSGEGWILYDQDFVDVWEGSYTVDEEEIPGKRIMVSNWASKIFEKDILWWDGVSRLELKVEVITGSVGS